MGRATFGWIKRSGTFALVFVACSQDRLVESPSLWSERDDVARRGLPTVFDTLWQIDGEADTTLLRPLFLDGGREGVTVWDFGRKMIFRITPDGQVAWSVGGEGEGPGEFRSVRSVEHLSNGGARRSGRQERQAYYSRFRRLSESGDAHSGDTEFRGGTAQRRLRRAYSCSGEPICVL